MADNLGRNGHKITYGRESGPVKINKETKALLGKEATDKIGSYTEAPGGGTPIKKGEKFAVADNAQEAAEMRANGEKNVRVMQPRGEDGKFEYNSSNGRKLNYGPSRGKTAPAFMKHVDLSKVIAKGSVLKVEGDQPGTVQYLISTIDMSSAQLVENAKHFLEDETGGIAGAHEGATVNKMGRHSEAEKKSDFGNTGTKVDISKIAKKTSDKMDVAEAQYQSIESKLGGIDADAFIATGNPNKAFFGKPGVTNYNKKAATDQNVADRDAWRNNVPTKPKMPTATGGSNVPPTPAPAKTPSASGSASGSSQSQAPAKNGSKINFSSSQLNNFRNFLRKKQNGSN